MILRSGHIKSFRELALSNGIMIHLHPRFIVDEIIARHGTELTFTYSRYEVASPGQQAAARRSAVLRVCACEVTDQWLIDRLAELGPTEELAWHSWVNYKGGGFHIPMIDLMGLPPCSLLRDLDIRLAAEMGFNSHFVFWKTGRSFHGYLPELIPENAWQRYLGQLLLLNEDDRTPLVDARWVGHALVRGFAALRWSHNTSRYVAMPQVASAISADGR